MLPRSLFLLVVMAFASDLSAQVRPATGPTSAGVTRRWERLEGSRIRVRRLGTSPDTLLAEGMLFASSGDTLYLGLDQEGNQRSVVAEGFVAVDEWHRSDPTKSLTVAGVIAGVVLGGVVANAVNDPPEPVQCTKSYDSLGAAFGCALAASIANGVAEAGDQVGAVLTGALVGGALLGVLGHALGQRSITEGWRPVTLRRLGVQPRLQGGLGFGGQITF